MDASLGLMQPIQAETKVSFLSSNLNCARRSVHFPLCCIICGPFHGALGNFHCLSRIPRTKQPPYHQRAFWLGCDFLLFGRGPLVFFVRLAVSILKIGSLMRAWCRAILTLLAATSLVAKTCMAGMLAVGTSLGRGVPWLSGSRPMCAPCQPRFRFFAFLAYVQFSRMPANDPTSAKRFEDVVVQEVRGNEAHLSGS